MTANPLHRVILGVLSERGKTEEDDLYEAVVAIYDRVGEWVDSRIIDEAVDDLARSKQIRRTRDSWGCEFYRLAPQATEKVCEGQRELF